MKTFSDQKTIDLKNFQVSTKRNEDIASGVLIDITSEANRNGIKVSSAAIESGIVNKIIMDMNPANRELLEGEVIPGICKRLHDFVLEGNEVNDFYKIKFEFLDYEILACTEHGDYNDEVLTLRLP